LGAIKSAEGWARAEQPVQPSPIPPTDPNPLRLNHVQAERVFLLLLCIGKPASKFVFIGVHPWFLPAQISFKTSLATPAPAGFLKTR
jgi:hypothetical protein